MGFDKATLTFEGRTLLAHVVAAGSAIGDTVVIGRSEAEGIPAVPDLRSGPLGPLAGLETAFSIAAGRDVVLVAVDQPFVRSRTLHELLSLGGDAVVPVDAETMQVTCAVYRDGCRAHVTRLLDEGRRAPASVLDEVEPRLVTPEEWERWGEDGRSWFSVDIREDLAEGRRRFGPVGEVRSEYG
jgi:molybdopterin-guanine dinucleotide biosynthesis protein A